MRISGFTAPPEEYWKRCPHCLKPLGKIEIMKRKQKRSVICKNCGKTIDEQWIRW